MIRLALPSGDLRIPIARLLASADLRVEGYSEGSRSYRLCVRGREDVAVRVFREKDIPIQIALGNYDLGVCNLTWVIEMQARFPDQPIVALQDMAVGACGLYAAGAEAVCNSLADLRLMPVVRIASDYPNLAEAFAIAARLPVYRIQAVWGAAEAYPPEDADVAVVAASDESALRQEGLQPLFCLLESSTCLIANATSLASRDLSSVLIPLLGVGQSHVGTPRLPPPLPAPTGRARPTPERRSLRMAVPDGHQQQYVVEALRTGGLPLEGYDESRCLRRPVSPLDGLDVKVIRPHDMPQLVATGEMDLAVTGRDCLMEHLYRFPSSPVTEILDLGRGQFDLSAVVSEELPATTIAEALEGWRSQRKTVLRVAAEFPAIADHYARSHHFWRYQVIPIAGASEGFVPEDADILIEGTETGRTLAENRLKAVDVLFRSTTCVIARRDASLGGRQREVFAGVMAALRRAVGAPAGLIQWGRD